MKPAKFPKKVPRIAIIVSALVLTLVVGVGAFSIGRFSAVGISHPTGTSADAGFARDMQVHHNQGVELAMVVRDRTDDPEVRLLAYDIATTQGQQSGQLYGWLSEWGLSQASRQPSMTWMTRPGRPAEGESTTMHMPAAAMPMPGLATPAQIAQLTATSGIDAERIFLKLMIAHHMGAVEMAQAVLERGNNSSVSTFATAVVKSQTVELEAMTVMLAQRS